MDGVHAKRSTKSESFGPTHTVCRPPERDEAPASDAHQTSSVAAQTGPLADILPSDAYRGAALRAHLLARGQHFCLGRYRVVGILGSGGMSIVYRALDTVLERFVALKVIQSNTIQPRDFQPGSLYLASQIRIAREARSLAQLRHPNIVTLYDVGLVDNVELFLAMEMLQGSTLKSYIHEHRPKWREIVRLYIQAGQGLAAAHAKGFVHRDFKPTNVMVENDKRVVVLDFGLVLQDIKNRQFHSSSQDSLEPPTAVSPDAFHPAFAASRSITAEPQIHAFRIDSPEQQLSSGRAIGTPLYMSPEQTLGLPCGVPSDIFSFALSLYSSLVGEAPFSSNDEQRLEAIRSRAFNQHWKIPRRLFSVLKRAMSFDAGERHASMEDLLSELEHILAPRPGHRFAAMLGVTCFAFTAAWLTLVPTHNPGERPDCDLQAQRIDSLWQPSTRAKIRAQFSSIHSPAFEEAYALVDRRLSDWVETWRQVDRTRCEIERGEYTGSEAISYQKNETHLVELCLNERKAALSTLLGEWTQRISPEQLVNAPSIAHRLSRPEDCNDVISYQRSAPIPAQAAQLSIVQDVREKLRQIETFITLGSLENARQLLSSSYEKANATHYRPLVAEVKYLDARLSFQLGLDDSETVEKFEHALTDAIRTRHASLAAEIALELTFTRLYLLNDDSSKAELLRRTKSLIAAAGNQVRHVMQQEFNYGIGFAMTGNYADALEHMESHARLARSLPTPDLTLVIRAQDSLAVTLNFLGEYERASEIYAATVPLAFAEYGSFHPESTWIQVQSSYTFRLLGRLDKSVPIVESAIHKCGQRTMLERRCALGFIHAADQELIRGDLSAAIETTLELMEKSGTFARNYSHIPSGADQLARALRERGEWSSALEVYRLIDESDPEIDHGSRSAFGYRAVDFAHLLTFIGDFSAAEQQLAQVEGLLAQSFLRSEDLNDKYQIVRATLELERQCPDLAASRLSELRNIQVQKSRPPHEQAPTGLLFSKAYLQLGELELAQWEAKEALGTLLSVPGMLPQMRVPYRSQLAEVYLAQIRPHDALKQILLAREEFDPTEILDNRLAHLDFLEARARFMLDNSREDQALADSYARKAIERYQDWDLGNAQHIQRVERWIVKNKRS